MLWMWETTRPACAVLKMGCPTGTQGRSESLMVTFNCKLWSIFRNVIHNCGLLCMAENWLIFLNRDDSAVRVIVSRVCLAYGGSDVTRTFFWLLQRAGFPYRDCQLANKLDCQLLQQLKETLCHLEQVCVGQGVGSEWKNS